MEAPTSITCPDCRQRWARYHDEQGRAIVHTPVGYTTVYVWREGREVLFDTARSYADLRASVARLAPGDAFTVHLNMFTQVVGIGSYRRNLDSIEVMYEQDAAEGLHLAMCEAAQ